MRRVNLHTTEFRHDDEDPEGDRAGIIRPGSYWDAKETGASLYEIPAGQSICPYHYEWAEEEWLYVLEGEPTWSAARAAASATTTARSSRPSAAA